MLGVHGERRVDEGAGRYRIVSQLGQGGTADVLLAVADGPAGFQKLVVLKVLRKSLGREPELRAMFLGEARLAARLHHPNIVQTNEIIEHDGMPALVMEYLEGQPLSQVIVRGRAAGFTLPMQLVVLADALHGLHAAHELADTDGTPLGLVHRDVSPHNLFVTVEGQVKVLDFGIAKVERSIVETEVGTIKGKLRYMAPEQIAGEKVDRRADLYAAGVILWEALVGERMWKGCLEAEIKTRVRAGDLQMPLAVRADVPPALDRICRRALALAPADRHPTALALAEEIEAALAGLGGAPGRREIGATVARLFDDVRAETRVAIERSVARLSSPGIARVTSTSEMIVAGEVADAGEGAAAPDAGPARRRSLLLVAAVAVVVVAIAALVAFRSSAPAGPAKAGVNAPAPADDPRPTPVGSAPVAPPSAAPAGPPPPATGSLHAGEGKSAGAARPATKHGARAAIPAAVPDGTGSAANPALDCAHPFFVDEHGIKKFRPECM
jgi:serine/threonine-protein kinase